MKVTTERALIGLAVIGFLVSAAVIYQQQTQLRLVQMQIAEQVSEISSLRRELDTSEVNRRREFKTQSLDAGIYHVETEVVVSPYDGEHEKYSIYNFVLDINIGAMHRKLQFGYGKSGWLTHVFYFDHDSDGVIDTAMMNEYASSIPGIDIASSFLVDPGHSQAVYDAFRINIDGAARVTLDSVADAASERVEALWNWLNEQSGELSSWIANAVEFG